MACRNGLDADLAVFLHQAEGVLRALGDPVQGVERTRQAGNPPTALHLAGDEGVEVGFEAGRPVGIGFEADAAQDGSVDLLRMTLDRPARACLIATAGSSRVCCMMIVFPSLNEEAGHTRRHGRLRVGGLIFLRFGPRKGGVALPPG